MNQSERYIQKMFKKAMGYYKAYCTVKEYNDLELIQIFEYRLEELLIELVVEVSYYKGGNEKMDNYETELRFYGIYPVSEDKDIVKDVLSDVAKIMTGGE